MLRVWLPLNGDLRNQGLKNVTVTDGEATIDDNGKIGKCYRFGTAKSFLELPAEAMNDFTTECTVSFWLKILTRNTGWDTYFQAGLGGTPWNNYVFGFLRNNSKKCCFTVSGESGTSSGSFVTSDMELDTWYHITLVYQTGHCLIYMNGMLYHDYPTTIVPAFNNITTITIGCANTKTTYQSNCLLNDLRIYDHALSPREVKQVSAALVLHYPLNRGGFGQDNLVNGLYAGGRTIVNNGIVTALLSQNSDCYFHFTCSEDLLAENDYTISMDVSGFSGSDKYLVCGIISQNSGQNITMRNGKCFAIFSPSSNITAGTKIIIDDRNRATSGLTDLTIRNIKVEHGSVATPWTPAPSDTLYSQMGLDNNIEYDVSGYNHNGIKYGAITYDADTPRYETSTHISATDQYIKVENLDTSGFGESYTFSWWSKVSTFSNMQWGFSNGVRLNGMYTGKLWNTGDSSNNPLYIPNTTTQVTVPTTNVWHHWVMTGDGTTCRVYQDGELWGIAKTYKSISGTTLCINGWNDTTSYKNSYMIISDFRIYATALSPEDVRDLYSVAASISDNGTLMASEVSEL